MSEEIAVLKGIAVDAENVKNGFKNVPGL